MAGGKETPRQKLIGIMYLVLMTLLALNVSKSILDAFVTQDEQGLEQNERLVESINGIKAKISFLKQDPQSKKTAEEIEPIVKKVSEYSNKADDFFVSELNALLAVNEEEKEWFKKDKESQITSYTAFDKMKKMDDYDTPSRFFGGGSEISDARGKALRQELITLRDNLTLEIAGSMKVKSVVFVITKDNLKSLDVFKKYLESQKHPQKDNLLDIYQILTKKEKVMQHHEEKDWNVARFYHQPMIGVVGTFTSLRNDIRLAQQKASKLLMEKIDVPMMNINKVEAKVLATTQYLNMGDELELNIGIVAYDSTKIYKITYRSDSTGDYESKDTSKLTLTADSPGPKYLEGKLYVEIAGEMKEKDWNFNYTVGEPSASIASPELNVMYMNYPNKIQAVASGFTEDQVKVSCSGCKSFSKSGEYYIAKVGGTKTATVTVTADGKKIGNQDFRVFPLPKPQAFFVGKTIDDKSISSGLVKQVKQGQKLIAKLADSPLDVPFTITGFDLELVFKGKLIIEKGKGASYSAKMINMLQNAGKGQKIYFTNVMAKGPSGGSKPIGDLSFRVL
jgi:gliding motility-associated protein GldM